MLIHWASPYRESQVTSTPLLMINLKTGPHERACGREKSTTWYLKHNFPTEELAKKKKKKLENPPLLT
jgi:hypothetical protein